MGLFSFFKKEKQLKCDWCGSVLDGPVYTKYVNDKKFIFCSNSCKQNFRKSDKGKNVCQSCGLSR